MSTPISPAERHLLLGFNPGPTPRPDRTVHASICRQAARTPDAVALRSDAGALTYRELLDRAALVAGRLAGAGIGPGCVVGLCARRSADLVVAVLGILLAGAAYLPVDPTHPAPRIASMLTAARAALLMVDDDRPPPGPDHPRVPIRRLDARRFGFELAQVGEAIAAHAQAAPPSAGGAPAGRKPRARR